VLRGAEKKNKNLELERKGEYLGGGIFKKGFGNKGGGLTKTKKGKEKKNLRALSPIQVCCGRKETLL